MFKNDKSVTLKVILVVGGFALILSGVLFLVFGFMNGAVEDASRKNTDIENIEVALSFSGHITSEECASIWVIVDGKEHFCRAMLSGITVEMRKDGQQYTTVRFSEKLSEFFLEYNKMVILVPVADDVEIWRGEVDGWRKEREKHLEDIKRKPERVLPR